MMAYVLVVLLSLSAVAASRSNLIGYYCADAPPSSRRPLLDMISSCNYQVTPSDHINAALVRENQSPDKVLVRQCTVRYNESVEGASHLMSAWTEIRVDRELCLKAHKTEKLQLHGQIVDLQVTGTQRHRIYVGRNDKACEDLTKCPDAKIRDYEISLTSYSSILSIPHNILRLEKKDCWCSYDDFECDYNGRRIFWEDAAADCEMHYSAVFSGKVKLFQTDSSRTFTVVETDNYRLVFELLNPHVHCLNIAFHTQDSRWKIVLGSLERVEKIDFDIGFFNERVYFEGHAKDNEVTLIKKMCKANNAILLETLRNTDDELILESNPRGVKVEVKGDHVILKSCRPVSIRVRWTQICYDRLPVYDQWDREMFLSPKSLVLVSSAKTVPCERDVTHELVRSWSLEDVLGILTGIGGICSFIWMMRSSLIKTSFQSIRRIFRRAPNTRIEETNSSEISKFRRLLNSFLVLIEPPFHF